jgi:hypothetical protein
VPWRPRQPLSSSPAPHLHSHSLTPPLLSILASPPPAPTDPQHWSRPNHNRKDAFFPWHGRPPRRRPSLSGATSTVASTRPGLFGKISATAATPGLFGAAPSGSSQQQYMSTSWQPDFQQGATSDPPALHVICLMECQHQVMA